MTWRELVEAVRAGESSGMELKRGEQVWYMPDPCGINVRFAKTLLLR